jgi:CheY-like chemotaxis protein
MLVVRSPGAGKPLGVRARITGRRSSEEGGPGRPAGFSLRVPDSAPSIHARLQQHAPGSTSSQRGSPRYAVRAPVKVAASSTPATAPPGATITYATERELEAAFIENHSQGGAIVRSLNPFPAGSPLSLQFRLPNGAELRAEAVVAFVNRDGMGVRFTLDAQGEATLQAAMAHLAARPRRAMVVDDDGPFRLQLAEALTERGFEVATSSLSGDGLRLVSEELRGLDLLLTGVALPGRGGESFVRVLRGGGARTDVVPAIVVVSGKMSPELERGFEAAGADAVLDRALGAELLAQAADAVLEQKRLA